jgi:hypothetical protein
VVSYLALDMEAHLKLQRPEKMGWTTDTSGDQVMLEQTMAGCDVGDRCDP